MARIVRRRPQGNPTDAADWRSWARYLFASTSTQTPAEIANLTDAELREEALVLHRRGLSQPAALILHALEAADQGHPFKPWPLPS